MIEISAHDLEIVKNILQRYVPDCEIRIFGSRLNKSPKKYADLDIAIFGKEKIPRKTLFDLQDEFEESDLPFRVDLLDWNRISKEFQGVIEKHYEVLPL